MRTIVRLAPVLAGLAIGIGPTSASEPPAPSVEKLIEGLASPSYAARERASRALLDRGPAALPALRASLSHKDEEVRRRARDLVVALEVAEGLQPKRITLAAGERFLTDAVEEIQAQTGYRLVVFEKEGPPFPVPELKNIPFWEAVDRLGRGTGREVCVEPAAGGFGVRRLDGASPFVAVSGPFRIALQRIYEDREADFTRPDPARGPGRHSQLFTISLSVAVEPRLVLIRAGAPRIAAAEDTAGKALDVLAAGRDDLEPSAIRPLPKVVNDRAWHWTEAYARRGPAEGRTLRVLRGTVPVTVVAVRKPVVVTETVEKAAGTECRVGPYTVLVSLARPWGAADFRVELTVPAEPERLAGRWADRVRLEDPQGNPWLTREVQTRAGSTSQVVTLQHTRPRGATVGPPARLIVEDWVIAERLIPFEFRGVPLP